jgi:FkbM family methyltransferase
MSFVARIAADEPWCSIVEGFVVRLGHIAPGSRIVRSFCLHYVRNKEKIAVLSTGGKMLLHLDQSTVLYYFLGTMACSPSEMPVERLLRRALREGDVFFDVGANVGFYTFLAAPLCGLTGGVHAFEANPALKADLIGSVGLNRFSQCIAINAAAVGETHGGECVLYLPSDSYAISLPSTLLHEWLNSGPKVTVPLLSIDGYMSEKKLAKLDVVKIDIEGGELNAFKGMIETFKTVPPALVICELMHSSMSFEKGKSLQRSTFAPDAIEIIKFMRARGYQPWHIRAYDGRLDHICTQDEIENIVSTSNIMNICFARFGLQQVRPELYSTD